jgi:hypothetical protein
MLNSGAIMNCALAAAMIEPHMKSSEKFDYILQYFRVRMLNYLITKNT